MGRVLVHSNVELWPIHLAEAVDLSIELAKSGHTVYFTVCTGQLGSCPANAWHSSDKCSVCIHQAVHTLKNVLGSLVVPLVLDYSPCEVYVPTMSTLDEYRSFEFEGMPIGEMALSQHFDDINDIRYDLSEDRKRLVSLISDGIAFYRFCIDTIRRLQLDAVYAWNGRRPSDGPVIWAGKKMGIHYECFISGGKTGTYTSQKIDRINALALTKKRIESYFRAALYKNGLDYVESEADLFYQNQRKGFDKFPGYIAFSANFEKETTKVLEVGLDKKKLVIFTSGLHENLPMRDYNEGSFSDHYEILSQILSNQRIKSKYKIFVRWHPNVAKSGPHQVLEYSKISQKFSEDTEFIHPDSKVNSYDILDQADVIITFGSTIGVEAAYVNKPSILLGRALYEDLNATINPANLADLEAVLMTNDLFIEGRLGAVKYGFYARNFGEKYFKHLTQNENDPWSFAIARDGKSISLSAFPR